MIKRIFTNTIATFAIVSTLSANNLGFNNSNEDNELKAMQSFMNNIMNQSFFKSTMGNFNMNVYPKTNIEELNDKYIINFELAGIDKSQIKLTLENNILTVQGERKTKKDEKTKDFVKQEIFYGNFSRSISLPTNVNTNNMKSKFKNGILTVTIPKKHITNKSFKLIKID